jgi:hypothetical protein
MNRNAPTMTHIHEANTNSIIRMPVLSSSKKINTSHAVIRIANQIVKLKKITCK